MTTLRIIAVEEGLLVGLSAVFLTPIMLMHVILGAWRGTAAYVRYAAWGGLFLLIGLLALRLA